MSYIHLNKTGYILPGSTVLFSDIQCTFNHEKYGIIGPNGSGKSTLLRLISGELVPSQGNVTVNASLAVVPQEFSMYNNQSVSRVLGIHKKLQAYNKILEGTATVDDFEILNDDWLITERLTETLERFNISYIEPDREFITLSGGERVRLILAKISLLDPDIFIMDEPTNNLDIQARSLLYKFLENWRKGFIIVSHDRDLLDRVENILELSHGKIIHYGGNYTFYKQQKEINCLALEKEYVEAQKALKKATALKRKALGAHVSRAKNSERKAKGGGIPKIVANARKNASQKSLSALIKTHDAKIEKQKHLLASKTQQRVISRSIKIDVSQTSRQSRHLLLKADDLNFSYSDTPVWADNLSFSIVSKDRVRIMGKNGSGKSTLIKILQGTLKPMTGELYRNIGRMAVLDQDVTCIKPELTLLENMYLYAERGIPEHILRQRLGSVLFYKDTVFKKAQYLSGGEKMRVGLACILMVNSESDILVLDEPTNNLDIESIEIISESLCNYKGTLIVISHDERFINDIGINSIINL